MEGSAPDEEKYKSIDVQKAAAAGIITRFRRLLF